MKTKKKMEMEENDKRVYLTVFKHPPQMCQKSKSKTRAGKPQTESERERESGERDTTHLTACVSQVIRVYFSFHTFMDHHAGHTAHGA